MENKIVMPAECAVLSEEEMTYTEGGKSVDFLSIHFDSRAAAIVGIGLGAVGLVVGLGVLTGVWAAYVEPSLESYGLKMPWKTYPTKAE